MVSDELFERVLVRMAGHAEPDLGRRRARLFPHVPVVERDLPVLEDDPLGFLDYLILDTEGAISLNGCTTRAWRRCTWAT